MHCRFSLFWVASIFFFFFSLDIYLGLLNVPAGMPKVLEKLMSSSTLMERLPGHWSNLTRVKIGDLV